jgi:hypothetical protein
MALVRHRLTVGFPANAAAGLSVRWRIILPLARRETGEGAREAAGEGPGQVEPLLASRQNPCVILLP